jgi:hypothetical protein
MEKKIGMPWSGGTRSLKLPEITLPKSFYFHAPISLGAYFFVEGGTKVSSWS